MKKILSFLLLMVLAFSFSGCFFTALLWSDGSHTRSSIIAGDKIYAFAKNKKGNEQIKKDSLIMIGKEYWYVVSSEDSKPLFELLQVKLSKPFDIKGRFGKNVLPIEITEDKGLFFSDFCLRYDTKNLDEEEKLINLGFKTEENNDESYKKCLNIKGKYFVAKKIKHLDYHFENSINATLFTLRSAEDSKQQSTLSLLAYTPVTLMIDLILLPSYIFF